jgi:hypothetical protein
VGVLPPVTPPYALFPRLLAALALAQRAGGRMFRGCRRLFLWLGREQQGIALRRPASVAFVALASATSFV